MPRDGNEIPILAAAITVIEYLTDLGRPASIAEIVEACGLSRSSAYRIIKTCEQYQWVEAMPKAGLFRIGARLLSKAARIEDAARGALLQVARPHLERTARLSGQTAKLSILDGIEALTIETVLGRGDYALVANAPVHVPLYVGASGKLLLSSLTDQQISDVLKAPMRSYTAATITDPEALWQEISAIRASACAQDQGEYNANTGAFAAPIIAPGGKMLAALSVIFLVDHVKAGSIRDLVIQAASAISRDLGTVEDQITPEKHGPSCRVK